MVGARVRVVGAQDVTFSKGFHRKVLQKSFHHYRQRAQVDSATGQVRLGKGFASAVEDCTGGVRCLFDGDWWKDLPETAEKYGFKITQEEVDFILGGNAARIFKLTPKPKLMEENKYGWKIRYPAAQQ